MTTRRRIVNSEKRELVGRRLVIEGHYERGRRVRARRAGLKFQSGSVAPRERGERRNAKHEMNGDILVGRSQRGLWIRWMRKRRGGKGGLNGGQWKLEAGGECEDGHHRRRRNRWCPWEVGEEKETEGE